MAKSISEGIIGGLANYRAGQDYQRKKALEESEIGMKGRQFGLEEAKLALELKKAQREEEDAATAKQFLFPNASSGPQFGTPSGLKTPNSSQAGPTSMPIPKTIKFGGQEFVNPSYSEYELAQKRAEDAQRPLSDTASSKLSAANQSLENIQVARDMASPESFNEMKSGFSKIRIGNKLGVTNPESIKGAVLNALPVTSWIRRMVKTTDDQKKFENNLSTLVEGQLRARTGAAAPQSEIDREVSRILASDDTLNSFLGKLSNAEKFVIGIKEGLRPGESPAQTPQAPQVPDWVPQGYENDYLEARKRGASDDQIAQHVKSRFSGAQG